MEVKSFASSLQPSALNLYDGGLKIGQNDQCSEG